jgi:cleavage stimulation factor subunit 3
MEYYCTKDAKIAGNIFELGFKKFKTNPDYILEYLDFLSHLNESNNTRLVFGYVDIEWPASTIKIRCFTS